MSALIVMAVASAAGGVLLMLYARLRGAILDRDIGKS